MSALSSSGWKNDQEKASDVLEHIIKEEASAAARAVPKVRVTDALKSERLLVTTADRTSTRVLFVTSDTSVLIKDSAEQLLFRELATVFGEVHVLLVTEGKAVSSFERIAANLYLYRASASYWFQRRKAVKDIVKDHLFFGGVARPDVVIALDPFLAGETAMLSSKMLGCSWQLHIKSNPFDPVVLAESSKKIAQAKRAARVLKRATSVRASSATMVESLQERFPKVADIKPLPQYYNLAAFTRSQAIFSLHDKYPQYKFILLTEGVLTADSSLHDVFTVTRELLRNPTVGLIVLANGPAKRLFLEKVKLLGIEKNVVFVTEQLTEVVSYYKTADLFIECSTDSESDVRILKAMSAGLPIAAYENTLRTDLLADGQSAFLSEARDTFALGKKVSSFMNRNQLRGQFKSAMKDIASYRLHENRTDYILALKDTIEESLLAG